MRTKNQTTASLTLFHSTSTIGSITNIDAPEALRLVAIHNGVGKGRTLVLHEVGAVLLAGEIQVGQPPPESGAQFDLALHQRAVVPFDISCQRGRRANSGVSKPIGTAAL